MYFFGTKSTIRSPLTEKYVIALEKGQKRAPKMIKVLQDRLKRKVFQM